MSQTLSSLSYELLRIRLIEEAIAKKYSEQKMRCPVHLSIGQEAIAVGVCQHLEKSDLCISNHRAHAHYLAKGGCLKKMIAEIYGKATGCSRGRGGSMHLIDQSVGFIGSTPIVGGTIPVGVGFAFSSMLQKKERVVAIFLGEGATEEGVFAESLNFAALHALKVLFICENNFYSVYSPLSVRQSSARDRVGIAKAHGIFALEGDGNEIDDVLSKTEKALKHVREGLGSAFLEFTTYRHREHCGPLFDHDLGYRSQEEISFWLSKDPIKNIEKNEEMLDAIDKEIEEAFLFAETSPFPDLRNERVYA